MKNRGTLLLALSLLLLSCTSNTSEPPSNTGTRLGFEDEISFVLLTEVLRRYSNGGGDAGFALFVSVRKTDPSPELLARLNKEWPEIRPASESYIDAQDAGWVKDKQTKMKGVQYQVYEIKRKNESNAEASAGYYTSNLGAVECTYKLRLENEAWVIVERLNCWAS